MPIRVSPNLKKSCYMRASRPAVSKVRTESSAVTEAAENDDLHERLALSVLEEFRVIFKSVRRHFHWVESQTGVSGAQLWVLAQVSNEPGIRVTELARALAIHQSTASNLVERLESTKLIERRRSDEDQRVVRLHLTPAGKRLVKRAPGPAEGVLPDALKKLPPAELQALKRQLVRLTRLMPLRDSSGKKTPLSEI